jgi:hypothetical protein
MIWQLNIPSLYLSNTEQIKSRQHGTDGGHSVDRIGNQRIFSYPEIVSHDPETMRCMP